MILSKPLEILFLEKECLLSLFKPVPQHQIDGIRFLHRQYKKKTPGVIVNDPSGYGKCLQIVLFLKALYPFLKKPALILSNSADNWKEHFERWTDCSDDLAIAASNPFSKHKIMINPIKDGLSFSRRAWGIVVLHDEYCTNDLLSMKFNADFKIWVTTDDLKENLHSLASIYEWLHPNQTFNVDNFTTKTNNWRDVVEKALLLDAFLEDFLIRRTDFSTPFRKPEKHKPSTPAISPVKATRKNKDPTGTKVKRSKRRRIEDNDDNINESAFNKTANDETNRNVADNNMDVESFIRNEKPIDSEGFNFIQNEPSDITVTMKVPEYMNFEFIKTGSDKISEKASQNSNVDFEKIIERENDMQENGHIDKPISDLEDKEMLQDTEIIAEETETQKLVKNANEVNRSTILAPATEEITESQSNSISKDHITRKSGIIIPETENSENTSESHNIFKTDNLLSNYTNSDDSQSRDCKIEIVKEKSDSKNVDGAKSDNQNNEIGDNVDCSKSDSENNEIGDNTTVNKTNKVTKESIMNELDAQLAEYQERALKKYGSILDKLF